MKKLFGGKDKDPDNQPERRMTAAEKAAGDELRQLSTPQSLGGPGGGWGGGGGMAGGMGAPPSYSPPLTKLFPSSPAGASRL